MTPADLALAPTAGHSAAVRTDAHLSEVIDLFRRHPHLRILAVLDADRRPVGIIREQKVRELLFCPYWFSLMQNPTIGGSIASMVEPCLTADIGETTAALLAIVSRAAGDIAQHIDRIRDIVGQVNDCLLYTSPSPRDS